MRIVDPHIHLWDLQANHYPWLEAPGDIFVGDYRPIARTYLLDDFAADTAGLEVAKVVHVDAGHDPTAPLTETRWLQAIADDPASGGMPQAIIGAIDLSDDNAPDVLEAHCDHANVRGVRQILNVHPNPYFDYVGRHYMREARWQENFGLLARHGLSFDLQIYPQQMVEAAAIADANPDIPIILNHSGMFADRDHPQGWKIWRDGIRALAARPNVCAKISGMGMLDHGFTMESIRPYMLEIIDAFGPDRAMFASNFPVDRLYSTYAELYAAFQAVVGGMSEAETAALFAGTAERVYRI